MAITNEAALQGDEARAAAKSNLNFLGSLAMPEDFAFWLPPFYLTLFGILTTFAKPVERYALGIPRGFAKTTFMKLLCIWYILFSHKKFILIVCASEELAVNVVSDIVGMLSHPNIIGLFGNWEQSCEENQKHKKVFFFRGRTIILQGIGAETSVRGINRNNKRPDVIIMDDIQSKEDAANSELAKKLLEWMVGTLMKARSNSDCIFIFVGNMYPQNSILDKLRQNKSWVSFVVGGILADGESLWPELKPIDMLLEEWEADKELGQEDIFLSEILNSTDMPLASGLDLAKLQITPPWWDTVEPDGSYILIDPSGADKTSDDCTINYFEVKDGKSALTELKSGTFTPKETIVKSIEIALRTDTRLICVESVAYQKSLLFWFNEYCEEHGYEGFHFMPVSPKGQAKNARIKKGAIRLAAGEQYLHPRVYSLVCDQYREWNPMKRKNKDDIIDPQGYVEEVHMTYPHLIPRQIFSSAEGSVSASHTDDIEMLI